MNKIIEYLNGSVWATIRPSPIHGVGVFAIRDIPEGQKITDFSILTSAKLYILDQDSFMQIVEPIRKVILDRSLSFGSKPIEFVSPNAQIDLRAFMNYSKTPNTDGTYTNRRIKAGEELTEDYEAFGKLSKMSREHFESFIKGKR